MLRLFSNAKYDFIGVRHYAYGITAADPAARACSSC